MKFLEENFLWSLSRQRFLKQDVRGTQSQKKRNWYICLNYSQEFYLSNRLRKQASYRMREKNCNTHLTKYMFLKYFLNIYKINKKKYKQHNLKKCTEDLQNFRKEDIQMANKHMKKWPTPLGIINVNSKQLTRYG